MAENWGPGSAAHHSAALRAALRPGHESSSRNARHGLHVADVHLRPERQKARRTSKRRLIDGRPRSKKDLPRARAGGRGDTGVYQANIASSGEKFKQKALHE